MRRAALVMAALVLATPASAVEFKESPYGFIAFTMPSNNVGCIYRDEEGTGLVLECDRAEPSYVRVRLFQDGKPKLYKDVADPSCCGAENDFPYGTSWRKGPFSCASTKAGLRCNNGEHGFSMSRSGVKTY
ncbi:hypothetical protein DK847_04225 [Aestuariivirga litoralis]|uniref:DUF2147 domain-containing protein n=1 Tax=Aestuariivirga litoralis TaxID=2650924 RepID=A0A2W2AVC3_9HYPH|nr:hypothetical protein [Aestuariivirga litoralis]PZF77652.1 hypothetical protein DK847_04225 [Aestuariivirga litoralis]